MQYKLRVDLYRCHNEFNARDYVIIQTRPKQYPLKTNKKLQTHSAYPFKVLQQVGPNAYVIDLPLDFDISSTFPISLCQFKLPFDINHLDFVMSLVVQQVNPNAYVNFIMCKLY